MTRNTSPPAPAGQASRPPAVIIHGLADARAALAPGLPVTLLSAPGAAIYAGAGWWRAIMQAVCPADPDILDCGTAAGRALEALRAGQNTLVLRAPDAILAEIRAMADRHGATILSTAPASLDLARPGAGRLLAAWLGDRGATLD
jgi:hypothetical protein